MSLLSIARSIESHRWGWPDGTASAFLGTHGRRIADILIFVSELYKAAGTNDRGEILRRVKEETLDGCND